MEFAQPSGQLVVMEASIGVLGKNNEHILNIGTTVNGSSLSQYGKIKC